MPLLRRGTFDVAIWRSVHYEYPALVQSIRPGDVVLDVGCHTGAVCDLAAGRGATVVGYEANLENFALATINLRDRPSVTLHHAAVWRSDVAGPVRLTFTPSADSGNTGGGSVLFTTADAHWSVLPATGADPAPPDMALSCHDVDAVALDEILEDLGAVRLVKLDVEGAEFPILLTATQLDRVRLVVGEYHEFTDAGMASLADGARVGTERYSTDLLRRRLLDAGFEHVTLIPDRNGRGYFSAERASA